MNTTTTCVLVAYLQAFDLSDASGHNLRWFPCHCVNHSQTCLPKEINLCDNCSHGFGSKFLLYDRFAICFSHQRKFAFSQSDKFQPHWFHFPGDMFNFSFSHSSTQPDRSIIVSKVDAWYLVNTCCVFLLLGYASYVCQVPYVHPS